MHYIILEKEVPGGSAPDDVGADVALKDIGEVPENQLLAAAECARDEGFCLMFEFDEKPDLLEVARLAKHGSVSSMTSMVRLWILDEELPPQALLRRSRKN